MIKYNLIVLIQVKKSMRLFIQIVHESTELTIEEPSFYSQYKYWIFFSVFLILFILLRLYTRRKTKQVSKTVKTPEDKKISEWAKNKVKTDLKMMSAKDDIFQDKTLSEEKQKDFEKGIEIFKSDAKKRVFNDDKVSVQKVLELEDINEEPKDNLKKPKDQKEYQIVERKELEPTIIEEIVSNKEDTSSKIKSIGFEPTNVFHQDEHYSYPLVLMPKPETNIKFPRKGCSNKTGYTEEAFFEYMQNPYFSKDFQLYNDRHIPSKNGKFVYEPDIVLIYEKDSKNIFIDIEIDEPYEGFSRTPTHERGADLIRNKFFTDRGWIVIRFSERQIHESPKECCYHIAKVIAAIDPDYEIPFHVTLYGDLEVDASWNSLQAKKWAKEKYRETYLGIDSFGTRPNIIFDYDIQISENDLIIENAIEDSIVIPKREKIEGPLRKNIHTRDDRLRFDPIEHRYYIDGNPDTISASQLISKFFPEFDSEYWSQRKAVERGVDVSVILDEWETKRVDAAKLGTKLHEEIENYYNGLPSNDNLPEFQYFLDFKRRYSKMKPYRSEWRIFDEEYLIAGTVDMVYQKEGDELYMFDWKRSAKVVDANGNPKLPNFDYASGELSHLSDNSYNKYAIQQNIYKHILEKRYNKTITSMNLLILHPNFETYHWVKLPDLSKEVKYIFENSKHYR